jgi:osmoprotectant transport system permease protein
LGRIGRRTLEHVELSFGGLLVAMLLGLPLGVVCARRPKLAALVLGASGVVQTVPSLALLVLLVPVLGIGTVPAVVALVVYSLFPVVEGTVTGLTTIDPKLVESADLLALPPAMRLRHVDLPLASPSIVSGLRTAAVLSVGTATLGAMVGAGGYGQPILTGVRLESAATILEGAVPAALLSLLVLAAFRFAERRIVPRGLVSHKEPRR